MGDGSIMHRMTCNELRLDLSILPVSPLSIQARGLTPPRFVRAIHPATNALSAYIPGSTLKGTLRYAAEHALRSAGIDCCDPEQPCSEREAVKRARGGPAIYRALCTVCRVFGSRAMRGHLTVTDSFPAEPLEAVPARDTDRPGEEALETVLNEPFYGTLILRNFERWQVGLLALLLSHINIADIQIGGNRSAGMGCAVVRYKCLSLLYPGLALDAERQEALQMRLHGVGQLVGANNPYGFVYPDIGDTPDLPESAVLETGPGFIAVVITTTNSDDPDEPDRLHGLIDNVLTQQALAWASYAHAHKGY
jgi:CRISPR/Cas system CSM-associated protein Csm3 (group 7 of RAMP superfamily)